MYSYKQMCEWYTNRIKMIEVKIISEYVTKFVNLNSQHPYNVLNFVTPYAEYPLCVANPDFFLLQAHSLSNRFLKFGFPGL
jgi:hypothetical protein